MTTRSCDALRQNLGAFVDGELPGAEMLRVSQHLSECGACAAEVESLESIGSLLRDAAGQDPAPVLSAGLASGVIARVGAEEAISWRATLGRAVEDCRWAFVGAGSVAATFVCAAVAAAVLGIGANPERADSLAGLMSNLQGSPGTFWIEGRRVGVDMQPVMLLVDSGASDSPARTATVVPASLRYYDDETEAELVSKLLDVIDRDGMVNLQSMSEPDRRYAEALLDKISELRYRASALGPAQGPAAHLTVYRLRLVASTEVTAKGLRP